MERRIAEIRGMRSRGFASFYIVRDSVLLDIYDPDPHENRVSERALRAVI